METMKKKEKTLMVVSQVKRAQCGRDGLGNKKYNIQLLIDTKRICQNKLKYSIACGSAKMSRGFCSFLTFVPFKRIQW